MFTYINGKFHYAEEAKISVRDRGFRLGDGAFETIAVHYEVPYQLELHIERLDKALAALKIDFDTKNLPQKIMEIISWNEVSEGYARVAISRGESGFGYSAKIPMRPTIVIETEMAAAHKPGPEKLWLSTYMKASAAMQPIMAKIIGNSNSLLARLDAEENGCYDSLLLDARKKICETSSGNIFWIVGDKLYTPKSGIMEGTTRNTVMKISPFEVVKGNYTLRDLNDAEEVFVTSVSRKILPINELQPIGLKWSKFEKTNIIAALLKEDIKNYAAAKKSRLDSPALIDRENSAG